MESIKDKPEARLMGAIFGENDLGYRPYIVVEDESKRRIGLTETIQEVLMTLSFKQRKALELRFGLLDGRSRTLKEVGRELSMVTPERARQIEARALRRLRHPSRSRYLRQFIVKEVSP